ncbi:KilA-N domain-containing protein [Acinetobacter radioresistens]|uniref:KilA-N domain-containing protein n=1 Tax=Acinetobacter radioresistens TaxID=40216 RepID=UPI00125090FF|nr:KilA-N domain-containing protein [Acinetobacter radioresistens]
MTSLTQNFLNPSNKPLIIGEFTIRQDEDGRYCLHDLHKASGGAEKHQPAFFIRNKQTKDLITEIESENHSANLQSAVKIINGGNNRGTYAVKELVYSYAMWISAKFHLMVIRAYDSLVMEWMLNGKQTISPEQAGILYNIVHTRAAGNKNLIVQMWSRLKNHFKYSASYRELRAIHFEDAKHYLEVMDLTARPEKHEGDIVDKLDEYLRNLASRFPALKNPIAAEIAEKIGDYLNRQDISEPLAYWVSVNNGKPSVQPLPVHYAPVDVVKLAERFNHLRDYMMGSGIIEQAGHLGNYEIKAVPR